MYAERFDLASDNTAGICPQAWQALEEANAETDASYGADRWTRRLSARVREIFETECEVFVVFNGTAANALALAQLCGPYDSVICHKHAHIETDECGAPEFFAGGAKLLLVGGANGKIDLAAVRDTLARHMDVHSTKPRVLSVTQATEYGTVYTREELMAVAELARDRSLYLHMDGARFANALVSLGCTPRALTWELGIDVLCFGGTKNGTGGGELVVFFKKELAAEFEYRVKQGGQLASKMRFLSAPWCGLLEDAVWLRNAEHANRSAALLERRLRDVASLAPVFPRQVNALFLRMPERLALALHTRGWRFYNFFSADVYRVMCSWATTEELLDRFVSDVQEVQQASA
ncbi:MAG TPA: low specificity L-threonine aldolase [Chthoniobacterales bacterium]|nr:low specificity L-threonine aldolase [Chthoniobacterales bacterium]